MKTAGDFSERMKDLYGLAPEAFIGARDTLVRELAEAGEAELAGQVKKLRKPSVAAWAVNAAARSHPDDVEGLLRAGAELQRAQRVAVEGKGAGELLAAAQARRKVIASLTNAAAGALGDRAGAHRDAIAATLEAASIDPELGTRLRNGTFEREASPGSGLGPAEGLQLLPGGAEPQASEDDAAERAELKRQAKEAMRSADAAERDAERAGRRAEQLRDKARAASAAADAAETEARRLADEARTERRRADRAERSAR
jgi:hypothetical protein